MYFNLPVLIELNFLLLLECIQVKQGPLIGNFSLEVRYYLKQGQTDHSSEVIDNGDRQVHELTDRQRDKHTHMKIERKKD